jgi:hypothetical protein
LNIFLEPGSLDGYRDESGENCEKCAERLFHHAINEAPLNIVCVRSTMNESKKNVLETARRKLSSGAITQVLGAF